MYESPKSEEDLQVPDLEAGSMAFVDKDNFNFDDLPATSPPLLMSRSAPTPSKTKDPALKVSSRLRRFTNPELTTKESHSRGATRSLKDGFDIYLEFVASIPFLQRNVSNNSSSVPLFLCAICLENHSQEDSFHAEACILKHSFCKDSLALYLTSQIAEGRVTSLKCPCFGIDSCEGVFSKDEVKLLVDEGCYEKYERYIEVKSNPNSRECPTCSLFNTTGNENNPEIVCRSCGTNFCYFHNNAHPSISCQEYIFRNAKSDMRSIATISATSRKCPKCKVPTQKSSGCNHMTCQHCNEDWCWLCGMHLDETHYDGMSRCSGMQFGEASQIALWNIFPCLRWPCANLIYDVVHFTIIAILVLIVVSFLCAAAPFSIVFSPFSLLFALVVDGNVLQLFLIPSLVAFGIMSTVFLTSLNLAYLPIPLLITMTKLFLNGCHCQDHEKKYLPCQVSIDDGSEEDDGILRLWFYPLYVLKSYFPINDDD
jgi:hypothetical protein